MLSVIYLCHCNVYPAECTAIYNTVAAAQSKRKTQQLRVQGHGWFIKAKLIK